MISSISDLKIDTLDIALNSETINCLDIFTKVYFTFYMVDYYMYMYVSKNYITQNIMAIKFLNLARLDMCGCYSSHLM